MFYRAIAFSFLMVLTTIAQASSNGLLGIQIGYPKFNFSSNVDQGVTYDGTTMVISSAPQFVTLTAGSAYLFFLHL